MTQTFLGLADTFTFEFVSDEFNGENVGAAGIRPKHTRTLTVKGAIDENVLSRVYLGVHWKFDGLMGQQIGEAIAAKITAAFPAKA